MKNFCLRTEMLLGSGFKKKSDGPKIRTLPIYLVVFEKKLLLYSLSGLKYSIFRCLLSPLDSCRASFLFTLRSLPYKFLI